MIGVTNVRDPHWLARMIQKPDQLLDEKDPLATALLKKYNNVRMPDVWITDDELQLLISYLQSKTAAREAQGPAAEPGATKPAKSPGGSRSNH